MRQFRYIETVSVDLYSIDMKKALKAVKEDVFLELQVLVGVADSRKQQRI